MKKIWSGGLLVLIIGIFAFGFKFNPANKQSQAQKKVTSNLVISGITTVHACKEPRLQMCTKEYRPVCAKVDTGIRCVKAPCPSSKAVTKPNACIACADKDVFSYIEGACEIKSK